MNSLFTSSSVTRFKQPFSPIQTTLTPSLTTRTSNGTRRPVKVVIRKLEPEAEQPRYDLQGLSWILSYLSLNPFYPTRLDSIVVTVLCGTVIVLSRKTPSSCRAWQSIQTSKFPEDSFSELTNGSSLAVATTSTSIWKVGTAVHIAFKSKVPCLIISKFPRKTPNLAPLCQHVGRSRGQYNRSLLRQQPVVLLQMGR